MRNVKHILFHVCLELNNETRPTTMNHRMHYQHFVSTPARICYCRLISYLVDIYLSIQYVAMFPRCVSEKMSKQGGLLILVRIVATMLFQGNTAFTVTVGVGFLPAHTHVIHTHRHTHLHMYTHHTHLHIYTHTHTHTHTSPHIHTHTSPHIHAHRHISTIPLYTHTHTHTHTHNHIYGYAVVKTVT